MHDATRTGLRRSLGAVADMGFRRIDHVRVIVGGGRPVAEVTGVTHRYPRTFRIPLASAARLANVGVPLQVEHRHSTTHSGGDW